ncbi:MAG: DUF3786 domain-containing protein [Spirochaetaceae bacterium]|jgi:hypothetical protein|nr:DUF3786 domain-containing protein [Spirochaetaceae bacterium]
MCNQTETKTVRLRDDLTAAKNRNNYDKIYFDILPYLAECDFVSAGRRLKFSGVSPERLTVTFCGRPFEVTKKAVRVLDGKKIHNNFLSVLIYYTISKADCEPVYDFTLLANLSEGVFAGDRGPSWQNWQQKPLDERFGSDFGAFHQAALRMGMRYDGETAPLEHSYFFHVLPKMPVKVKYYEADEEFPVQVKIFWDKTATQFLTFEPLAVLNGCLISAIADA